MHAVEALAERLNYPKYRQALGRPADLYQALAITAVLIAVTALIDTVIGLGIQYLADDVRKSVKTRQVLSGFNFICNLIISLLSRGQLKAERGAKSAGELKLSKIRVALGFFVLVFSVFVELAAIYGGLPTEKEVVEYGTLLRLNYSPKLAENPEVYRPTANPCDSIVLDGDVQIKNIEVCNIKLTLTGKQIEGQRNSSINEFFDKEVPENRDQLFFVSVSVNAGSYDLNVISHERSDTERMTIVATDTRRSKYLFHWPKLGEEVRSMYITFKRLIKEEFKSCRDVGKPDIIDTFGGVARGLLNCSKLPTNLMFERVRKEMRRNLAIEECISTLFYTAGVFEANENHYEPLDIKERPTTGTVNIARVTGYRMNAIILLPLASALYILNIVLSRFDKTSDVAILAVNAHYDKGLLSDAFHDIKEYGERERKQRLIKSSFQDKEGNLRIALGVASPLSEFEHVSKRN